MDIHSVRGWAVDALSSEGRRSLVARASRRLEGHVAPDLLQVHLLPADVWDNHAPLTPGAPVRDRPLRVGWVMTPPGPGSGGHTTIFRMIRAMEQRGHTCEVLLYDPFHGDTAAQERVIRTHWPRVEAAVRSVDSGAAGLDAAVASGWQTAHVLASRSHHLPLHRFYFIQDYEPYFYPHGFEHALAEASYDFGLHGLALGGMVAGHVRPRDPDVVEVPFGCDTETYTLENLGTRSGVAVYARAGTSRRGFLLAQLALEELHRRRPKLPVHVYGLGARAPFTFPVTWHGRLDPSELNALYNVAACGLALSFTNISLVAGEMLSAGCVPVVNDSPDARADLSSPYVQWSRPTPVGVAEAVLRTVDEPPGDLRRLPPTANPSWEETGRRVVDSIERLARAQ